MFFISDKSYIKLNDSYTPINKPSIAGSGIWGTELAQFLPAYLQIDIGTNYKNYNNKTVVVTIEYTRTDK